MIRYILALFLYAFPALACDTPTTSIIQGIQMGWPHLLFHYTDDEARLVVIQYFNSAEVDEIFAFEGPGRPAIFIASLNGCTVGRSVLPPGSAETIMTTVEQYRHYKKLEKWKTNP